VHTRARFAELRIKRGEVRAEALEDDLRRPKISVMVITYNHERYIAQALDSILMQQRDFDLEINVIDDASTDRTQEIVRNYAARHAEVRCHFGAHNVGHIATQLNTYRGFQTLRGEYWALLEGDDYWTDPAKLRKQIEFLDAHPEYVACGHDTLKVYEDGSREPEHFLPFKEFGRHRGTIGDIVSLSAVFHLSSVVYRNVFGQKPPLCLADPYSCETTINMVYAQYGDFYHLPGYMSVYRAHGGGVFSTRSQEDIWRFHLHGFDRFGLYLGWRYLYWFARAISGFSHYVLNAHRRGVSPPLRLSSRLMFWAHLVAARPVYWGLNSCSRAWARLQRMRRAKREARARRSSFRTVTYGFVVMHAPPLLLRMIVRMEERWPALRRWRRKLKP